MLLVMLQNVIDEKSLDTIINTFTVICKINFTQGKFYRHKHL